MARTAGLENADLKLMNLGDVLEYVYEWIEFNKPKEGKENVRWATQEDIDRLF